MKFALGMVIIGTCHIWKSKYIGTIRSEYAHNVSGHEGCCCSVGDNRGEHVSFIPQVLGISILEVYMNSLSRFGFDRYIMESDAREHVSDRCEASGAATPFHSTYQFSAVSFITALESNIEQ